MVWYAIDNQIIIIGGTTITMNKLLQRSTSGFTIVELLIVIVVIGILAAITIVSYTGITSNAYQKTALSNAQSVKSVVDTIYADTGNMPTSTATITGYSGYSKLPSGVSLIATAGTFSAPDGSKAFVGFSSGGVCIGVAPQGATLTASTLVPNVQWAYAGTATAGTATMNAGNTAVTLTCS